MTTRLLEQIRELLLHPTIKGVVVLGSLMWANLVEHLTIEVAYTLLAVSAAWGMDLVLGMRRAWCDPQMVFSLKALRQSASKALVWFAFLLIAFVSGTVIDALRGEHEFQMSFWMTIAGGALVVSTDGLSALEHLRYLTGGRSFPLLERYLSQVAAGRYDTLLAGVQQAVRQAAGGGDNEAAQAPAGS